MARINPIELQKSLKGVEYPASKEDLIDQAEENGAEDSIISALEELEEEEFQTPAEVSEAIGKLNKEG